MQMEMSPELAYVKALKSGLRAAKAAEAEGRNPYMIALEETISNLNELTRVPLGLLTVPLDRIVGSVSAGRTPAFAAGFKPLLHESSEFGAKWRVLYESVVESGVREPVKLVEYMNQFYAVEGNKRISVMKQLEAGFIEADVTRALPKRADTKESRVYFEFLDFYADTNCIDIVFTEEGSYKMLTELSGHTPGIKWPEDDVKDLRAAYYRFKDIVNGMGALPERVTAGDVLLVYLQAFGYEKLVDVYESELRANLNRMRGEVDAMTQEDPLTLKMTADGQAPGIIRQLFRSTPTLKVCFINNRSPEFSGWTYWHSLGRNHVDSVFDRKVTTTVISNVAAEDCQKTIEQAVADGANVVFTTSPVLLDGAMKAAMKLPEARILNCSLLPVFHAVRSYYLRMYEAKFILGAIAGTVADNDRIGYIADYPVYGVPTSVNAFALGARLTNPRAKVFLEWSTVVGHSPEEALSALNVSVICNRDIAAPSLESNVFGLYETRNGRTQNLAMPVWQWGKLYEDLIRRIQNGLWDTDTSAGKDAKALNYWWGMDAGAIDVYYTQKLDAGTRRLIEWLRNDIKNGSIKPFSNEIVSQDGQIRCKEGEVLTPAQLVTMDWLCDNIVGGFPSIETLRSEAKAFVNLQGIGVAKAPELSEIRAQEAGKA